MLLRSEFGPTEQEAYNALGTVEDAFAALKQQSQFRPFLEEFRGIARESNLLGKVGAFLLHRHFLVGEGQVLLETPSSLGSGEDALVAAPSATDMSRGKTPCRWMVNGDGSFTALEFSTDPIVQQRWPELQGAEEFATHFAQSISKFELTGLLGLCAAERATLTTTEDEILIEETTSDASVVTVKKRDAAAAESIPTSWVPSTAPLPSPQMLCEVIMGCVKTGCSAQSGGHVEQHSNRQVRHINR